LIYVYGQDLDDYSQQSKQLVIALRKAGFRRGELEVLRDPRDLYGKGKCYVLTFGASAYGEITGRSGLTQHHGELHSSQWSDDALVYPTFSPGYLRRNPRLRKRFKIDLENFYAFIKLDEEGVL
jgi:hypothetical protein